MRHSPLQNKQYEEHAQTYVSYDNERTLEGVFGGWFVGGLGSSRLLSRLRVGRSTAPLALGCRLARIPLK